MKRFAGILIAFALVLSVGIPVAYAEDAEYKTFMQGDGRWGSYEYDSGYTLARTGCMITSIAVLKAYADPSLRDVNKFNPKVCATQFNFIGGAIYWGGLKEDWVLEYNQSNFNIEDGVNKMKECMDKGLYIVLGGAPFRPGGDQSYSHYCPVVGWNKEKDEPILWDVGWGVIDGVWERYVRGYKEGSYDGRLQVIAYRSTVSSSKDTIFSGSTNFGSYTDSLDQTLVERAVRRMTLEWDLKGMPTKGEMSVSTYVDFADREGLTTEEILGVESIKDGTIQKITTESVLSVVSSVLGGVLIVYGVLLLGAFVLDSSNTVLDVSLVSILTVGGLKLADDKSLANRNSNLVTKPVFFLRCTMVIAAGILIMSGLPIQLVTKVVYLLRSVLG